MSKTFEERLEERKETFCKEIGTYDTIKPAVKSFYGRGAEWGYHEGINAAIDMLRNEKAIDDHLGMHERSLDEWADWLEGQFKDE